MVRITTSAQAAQRDTDAIASGIESWTLMLAAGSAAAQVIVEHYANELMYGALVYAGSGNNGGDAHVVAARLVEAGARVVLQAIGEPRTTDAKRAAAYYEAALLTRSRAGAFLAGADDVTAESCALIVDGLLGTGQRGELRDAERSACRAINAHANCVVIALDVPTGVNATTGEVAADAVCADHTISFGSMKRAHVLQRAFVGTVTVVDIGLGSHAEIADGAWTFADEALVHTLLPAIAWNAYKGTRGRMALVGGAQGMAGAMVLASRAALRAGAGLVYTYTAKESANALQLAEPQVIARTWRAAPDDVHGAGIGPGLGRDKKSQQTLAASLVGTTGVPTVLDADALTLLSMQGDGHDDDLDEVITELSEPDTTIARLSHIAATRPVLCTPHVGEFARLIGTKVADTLEGRMQQATQFASATGAVILLKGTPTVVVSPDGSAPVVVARGNAVLATGGSGDLLTGLITALLAQGATPRDAGIVGAWVHGRAAEIAAEKFGTVRGVTLDDVLTALPVVWRDLRAPSALPPPVIALLPSVFV